MDKYLSDMLSTEGLEFLLAENEAKIKKLEKQNNELKEEIERRRSE